jgi:hypothetical protein
LLTILAENQILGIRSMRPGSVFAQPMGNAVESGKVASCCNAKSAGTIQTAVPLKIDTASFSSLRGRKPPLKCAGSTKKGSAA